MYVCMYVSMYAWCVCISALSIHVPVPMQTHALLPPLTSTSSSHRMCGGVGGHLMTQPALLLLLKAQGHQEPQRPLAIGHLVLEMHVGTPT